MFDVAELHEHILSFLPFKDLLLAQRVSKGFKAAITSSVSLQQKLHLLPMKADAAVHGIEVRPGDFFRGFTRVQKNNRKKNFLFTNLRLDYCKRFNATTRGYGSSWRKMYATQPPMSVAMAMLAHFVGDKENDEDGRVGGFVRPALFCPVDELRRDGGITLGDMVDHAYAQEARYGGLHNRADFSFNPWG